MKMQDVRLRVTDQLAQFPQGRAIGRRLRAQDAHLVRGMVGRELAGVVPSRKCDLGGCLGQFETEFERDGLGVGSVDQIE